jgi:hypothetical protein
MGGCFFVSTSNPSVLIYAGYLQNWAFRGYLDEGNGFSYNGEIADSSY